MFSVSLCECISMWKRFKESLSNVLDFHLNCISNEILLQKVANQRMICLIIKTFSSGNHLCLPHLSVFALFIHNLRENITFSISYFKIIQDFPEWLMFYEMPLKQALHQHNVSFWFISFIFWFIFMIHFEIKNTVLFFYIISTQSLHFPFYELIIRVWVYFLVCFRYSSTPTSW